MMTRRRGFTLLEALMAIATLAMLAGGVTAVYVSSLQTLEVHAGELTVCSALRSEMERLMALPFPDLPTAVLAVAQDASTGESTASVRSATVEPADLDGDGTADSDAVILTVTIDGRSLKALRIDNQGRLGKL